MLPPEVSITNEGLGLLQDSYHDLEGKTDEVAASAADFVQRNQVQGLIVTGGFVTLFNPGLEGKVAEAVQIPVTSAVSSVTTALRALSATRVMLVTPFTADMNAQIEKHLTNLGFTVFPSPPYDKTRKPGGGTLDPLPIIQRLEDNLGVPVISSNTAMIWNILSKLGLQLSIKG